MINKTLFAFVVLAAALCAASQSLGGLHNAMAGLCGEAKSLLPVTAMTMIVFSGIIYAAGQILGAETRARANVWATAALTGALIGILIYAIAPGVLSAIYNGEGTGDYVDIASSCTI